MHAVAGAGDAASELIDAIRLFLRLRCRTGVRMTTWTAPTVSRSPSSEVRRNHRLRTRANAPRQLVRLIKKWPRVIVTWHGQGLSAALYRPVLSGNNPQHPQTPSRTSTGVAWVCSMQRLKSPSERRPRDDLKTSPSMTAVIVLFAAERNQCRRRGVDRTEQCDHRNPRPQAAQETGDVATAGSSLPDVSAAQRVGGRPANQRGHEVPYRFANSASRISLRNSAR
jgi:hypothetical protein